MFFLNLFFLGALWAPVSFASPKIVYGKDDRVDTFASPSPLFRKLALSTAAQIHQDNIAFRAGNAELRGKSLGEMYHLCSKERFYYQPFIANCSGFLVAPDIIATAGHCVESKDMCTQYRWVFDYKVDHEKQSNISVPESNVYKCREILIRKSDKALDFALVRLERAVNDRSPVKLANEMKKGTPVVLIGHPSGLPQKIADNAVIKSISVTEFKANVDAFQINSGSAVFNAITGDLLGILVRGQKDYRTNRELSCTEPNTTDDQESGEDIASYTQFASFLKNYSAP